MWPRSLYGQHIGSYKPLTGYSSTTVCLNKLKMWQPLTVFCQGLHFSRVSQAAGNLQLNPSRFQAEKLLEQKPTLMKRAVFPYYCSWATSPVIQKGNCNTSAGQTSLKVFTWIYLKNNCMFSHTPLGKSGLHNWRWEGLSWICTCLAVFGIVSTSQAFKAQMGDTTSTECFAWSSSVWKPTERGKWVLPSMWMERSSGIFSTSLMLK